MHPVGIRQEIIDRVMARRGRLHWFERLEPAKTALVAVDMQSTSDVEHRATLETHIQQFGDVATADEALQLLGRTEAS